MKENYKKIIAFAVLFLLVSSLFALLFFYSPKELVGIIGVRNGYLLAFFVSFFGGFSAAGSVSFITILFTLTAGGMNPFYLALVSGFSLSIGDILMFYTAEKGRELIRGKWDRRIDKLSVIFKQKKIFRKILPFLAYIYVGFTPFPNDILIVSLAALRYPRKLMVGILILGDVSFTLLLTTMASRGIQFFN